MLEYVVVGLIALFALSNILRMMSSRLLVKGRRATMKALEEARGSRIITMIHRQKTKGIFAMLSAKFIDIEDSMSILEAIRKTPDDMPIDFIMHTPGGLVLASSQIARALAHHKGEVRVIVPHYAMSGGTLLAMAADKIVMDPNAVLGPVDPQIGSYPAASLLKIPDTKSIDEVNDETLVLVDVAEKAIHQMHDCVMGLLTGKGRSEEDAEDIATTMVNGTWTHDHPLTYEFFEKLGFDVDTDVPDTVFDLMKMFPNLTDASPSVEYIPLPHLPDPELPLEQKISKKLKKVLTN